MSPRIRGDGRPEHEGVSESPTKPARPAMDMLKGVDPHSGVPERRHGEPRSSLSNPAFLRRIAAPPLSITFRAPICFVSQHLPRAPPRLRDASCSRSTEETRYAYA